MLQQKQEFYQLVWLVYQSYFKKTQNILSPQYIYIILDQSVLNSLIMTHFSESTATNCSRVIYFKIMTLTKF